MTPEERFWSHVDQGGDCWEWDGAHDRQGYAITGKRFGTTRAHRVAYILTVGPVPSDLVMDHLCRNRGCVNPAHLEPVTARENLLRGETLNAINAAKTHCPRGHELAGDNLIPYRLARGLRECKTCARDATRARRARAKASA